MILCCFVVAGCSTVESTESNNYDSECIGFTYDDRCCAYCSDVLSGVSTDYLCDNTISKYKWETLIESVCSENVLCFDKSIDTYNVCFSCMKISPKTTSYFDNCKNDRKYK